MNKKRYFIAGTDTGVGKTTITLNLLSRFEKQGFSTAAIKPIAAGVIQTNSGLHNDDALKLQKVITTNWPYEAINPFLFDEPISPNLAADNHGISLSSAEIACACEPILDSDADVVIVEGAGGWFVPINDQETIADIAIKLNIPVILVVGLRLGCLSHTILTYQAIQSSGLKMAGWVANQIDRDMLYVEENINYLTKRLPVPLLGIQPYTTDNNSVFLNIPDSKIYDDF